MFRIIASIPDWYVAALVDGQNGDTFENLSYIYCKSKTLSPFYHTKFSLYFQNSLQSSSLPSERTLYFFQFQADLNKTTTRILGSQGVFQMPESANKDIFHEEPSFLSNYIGSSFFDNIAVSVEKDTTILWVDQTSTNQSCR